MNYIYMALLLGSFFSGCAKSQEEKELTIADKNVSIRIEASVYPSLRQDVIASVSGRVKQLYINYGDKLKKGDIVYSLDKELIMLDIQNKKTEIESLENIKNDFKRRRQADSNRETINMAALELQKVSALKSQGYIRAFEENTYKKNYINAVYSKKNQDSATYEKIKNSEVNLATKKVELQKLQYQLKHADTYSSIDGFVADIQIKEGESIGVDKKVCTIINLDNVIVKAGFANGLLPFIHKGQVAELNFVTSPPYQTKAKVQAIVPIVNPAFDSMTLDLVIPNKHYILQEGTRALVTIKLSKEGQAEVRKYFMHNKRDRTVQIQSKI